MSDEELKKSVKDWKEIVDKNAFADSIAAFTEAVISTSPMVDKVSTWAAAGTATVAGLAITNIGKISSVYSISEVKWLFSCLAFSIACALIQKFMSLTCVMSLKITEEVKNRFTPVLETYTEHEENIEKMSKENNLDINAEYDFPKVLEAYINLFPKWLLFFFKSKFEKATKDRTYPHKLLISRFITQNIFAFLQYFAILIFIVLAAVFI